MGEDTQLPATTKRLPKLQGEENAESESSAWINTKYPRRKKHEGKTTKRNSQKDYHKVREKGQT